MILIIEGADLVGKSTLASRVSDLTQWPIVKVRWALVGDPMSETVGMSTTSIEILRATKPNIIFDRAYFSWWAYGPPLGYDASFLRDRIAQFARVSEVTESRLIVLTATRKNSEDATSGNPIFTSPWMLSRLRMHDSHHYLNSYPNHFPHSMSTQRILPPKGCFQ